LVPVNADVPSVEVIMLPEQDDHIKSGWRQRHRRAWQRRHQCRSLQRDLPCDRTADPAVARQARETGNLRTKTVRV
jgi:hypothetical protein